MSEIDNAAEPEGAPVFQMQHDLRLRDWFAGQALPAVIAATASGQHHPIPMYTGKGDNPKLEAAIARDAYAMADAMLEARKAKP